MVLKVMAGAFVPFAYRTITVYGRPFQRHLAREKVCNSVSALERTCHALQPPEGISSKPTLPSGFGLFPFRSPLLGESRLISFPRGTKMFQFPRFPHLAYVFSQVCPGFTWAGCPIRVSPAKLARQLTEAYRSHATPVLGP